MTWAVQRTGGNWTRTVSGGKGPSGTASLVGSRGQIWSFTFDQGSKGAFDPFLATLATSLCETIVTRTQPSAVTHFNLKLNKRDSRAKLTRFAQALGSSMGGMGNGNLKLVLRGPWQTAPYSAGSASRSPPRSRRPAAETTRPA